MSGLWYLVSRSDFKSVMFGQLILIVSNIIIMDLLGFETKVIEEFLVFLCGLTFVYDIVCVMYFWNTSKFDSEQ